MSVRERLFSEFETLCKGAGLDFGKMSQELSEFIGADEVIDYYIAQEPLESFPDTRLDVLMLSQKSLYDYEVQQKGVLLHVLPLRWITGISERFGGEEEDVFIVAFEASGLGSGLACEGKWSESGKLRRFSSAVRKKVLESI